MMQDVLHHLPDHLVGMSLSAEPVVSPVQQPELVLADEPASSSTWACERMSGGAAACLTAVRV